MIAFRTRQLRGGVVTLLLGGIAAGLLFWAAAESLRSGAAHRLAFVGPVTDDEVGNWLTRIGFDAESLAAAGVSAESIETVVADARAYLTSHAEGLRSADDAVASARGDVDRLTRLIQSGLGNEQDVSDLQAAQSALASAVVSRESQMQALADAAGDSLQPGQIAVTGTVLAHKGAKWELPVQYLAMSQSEVDRITLRNALAHKRIAERLGQEVSQAAAAYINTCNLDPAVVAANQGLVNLEAVTTAWNDAVHPEP